MSRPERDADAGAMVTAVQDAAVEHALTAGDARRALALAGALEPLRGEAAADGSDPDPVATALLSGLTAWIRLREGSAFGPAEPPAPPEPPGPAADAAAGDADPAVVGAALACERFDVPVARAASLAACAPEAVARRVDARERPPVR